MKLATYHDGSRDGQLVVVSRDLGLAHFATGIATRLQQVLDDWNFLSPQLEELSATLNGGKARHAFAFDPRACRAPLPRAYRWALHGDAGSPSAWVHAAGDLLLGPRDGLVLPADTATAAALAGVALVTGDLPQAAPPERVLEAVRLTLLFCTVRTGPAGATADDAAALRPGPCAFGPVAVTPDELGDAWHGGRVTVPLAWHLDGRRQPAAEPAVSMPFGPALAALTAGAPVRAGSLVGSAMATLALPAAAVDEGEPADEAQTQADADADAGVLRVAVDATGRDGSSVWGGIETRVRWPRSRRPSGSP